MLNAFKTLPYLALMLACGYFGIHAADSAETTLLAAARTPGPGQAKALARLGDDPPGDAVAVAAALVDGVLSTDVSCRIYAGQAIRSQLTSGEDNTSFRVALAAHAGRLLSGAEAAMADRINPPLEALAGIETPSGAMTPRLIELLAPGLPYRRYTLGVLARSRPLTAEIKRVVLAEASNAALVQQDLVIAMQTWADADLVGEDIDRALVMLFDASMGSIQPRIIDLLKRHGQHSPIVAARLVEILSHPLTSDGRFRDAMLGYAASVSEEEEMALIGRLLGLELCLDPDRAGIVLKHLDGRQGLPPALCTRLAILVQNPANSWYLRHQAARLLINTDAGASIAAQLTELAEAPAWIVEADSAQGWPIEDIEQGQAKAGSAAERTAWAVAKLLQSELAAREHDKDFNQRRGAVQVACLARWSAQHPKEAGTSFVVCRMLDGYMTNHAPTPDEQAQCIAYITGLLARGFCTEDAMVEMRYPQGGPSELCRKVHEALTWACKPASRPPKGATTPSPWLVARSEAARMLHAMQATPRLVLRAERELASSLRSGVHEDRLDVAICRNLLLTCRFSTMPIPAFMAELEVIAKAGAR